MHKAIDVKLTSIFSPTCQALIHESSLNQIEGSAQKLLDNSSELLVIRLENTVIGYASLKSMGGGEQALDSIYFRNTIKDHILGEQWFTSLVKRHLENNSHNTFLLAS